MWHSPDSLMAFQCWYPDGFPVILARQTALWQREIMRVLSLRLPLSSASWMHIICTRFLLLEGERRSTAIVQLLMQLWPMMRVSLMQHPEMLFLRPRFLATKVFAHWCWSVGYFRHLNCSYRQQLVALRELFVLRSGSAHFRHIQDICYVNFL